MPERTTTNGREESNNGVELASYSFVREKSSINATTMDSKKSAPFEWLAGGFLFGKKGGIESIDSSKDINALLTGIDENLGELATTTRDMDGSSGGPAGEQAVAAVLQQQGENGEGDALADHSSYLAARLARVRFLLYDERRMTSQQEVRRVTPTVAQTALQGFTSESLHSLMPHLLSILEDLPFESRKHVAAIFNYLLVCGLDGSDADIYEPIMNDFRDYVLGRFDEIMRIIVKGHESALTDICLHAGSMYRSCLRHPVLYATLVGTHSRAELFVFPFLNTYAHLPNFEIASDAIESLRMVLTACSGKVSEEASQEMSSIAADFMVREYETVFTEGFRRLLNDDATYLVRRVALQILSCVLLTRSNYSVMVKYVAVRENLILIMHLLRDNSPHITLDAFHVFKVFVANPNKPAEVVKILKDNQTKLCAYLTTLHQDKEAEDEQFRDEKKLIIATIEAL